MGKREGKSDKKTIISDIDFSSATRRGDRLYFRNDNNSTSNVIDNHRGNHDASAIHHADDHYTVRNYHDSADVNHTG